MRASFDNYNFSFNAIPLAQWRCKTINNKTKNITIIALEKQDLNFIKKYAQKTNLLSQKDKLKEELIEMTLNTIQDVLNVKDKTFEKVKMFLALHEGTPCGLLVGNIPKQFLECEQIKYSSRHNSAKNETELDWLVTWQGKGKSKIKGIGKALVCEFFRTIKKDKFRDVFVRSEVPEKSYATNFYEEMGFEQLGNKRLKLFNRNSAQYVISDYGNGNDEIIPMLVTRKKLQEITENLSKKMCRQEFVQKSVDINDLIE